MSVFRRRKREEPVGDDRDDRDDAAGAAESATAGGSAQGELAPPPPARPQGPWDVADVADPEAGRVDLGGMLVPVPPDSEVRVDVSPEGEVVAATVVQGAAHMQVNAFAAPRTEGIWQEVRDEIRVSLLDGGGQVEEREGPFGPELHALVPTEVPGQGPVLAPARFIGVDGPRWFLRALFTGEAAVHPEAAAPLEAALREVVVVRGGDPMAVRDPLPLRLPREVAEQAAAEQAAAEQTAADQTAVGQGGLPQLPERGPEITETR